MSLRFQNKSTGTNNNTSEVIIPNMTEVTRIPMIKLAKSKLISKLNSILTILLISVIDTRPYSNADTDHGDS
jgi:hypothetical protein